MKTARIADQLRDPFLWEHDNIMVRMAAADEIEQLRNAMHRNDRWNVCTTEGGFKICRGDHERSDPCEWEYYVPDARKTP